MPNNNNNNNNNLLGHNINFNDAPNVESGLGGYFTGNAARNEFSNKFWDDQNGYLSTVTKELDQMLKQYRELAKYSDQMTKTERQAVRERQRALREEAKVLKNIKDQQDVSAEVASGVIKEATHLLTNSQAGLAKGWNLLQDKTDDALKNVEKASNHYTKIKDDFTKMNKEMGNLINTANKASDSFATSLSTTLKSAGDRLANISNMFNLQKIAGNTAEQNARSIEKIQSDTMKQFGFSSNTQYWNFVDSLNNNLKSMNSSMGNLFNIDDLKQYVGNLGAFGITDTKMAQQQMKNSIIATKYLGVSADTQQLMFKYMKRTNNNDTIEKHNQMIVGLLQSQLGVSKEQLDVLSQQTYEDADALAAFGADKATQDKYIQESTASKTAMESIAPGWGKVLGTVFNEMIAMPYGQMVEKYGKIFGSEVTDIYDQLTKGNAINATKMIAGNSQLMSLISGKDTKNTNTILNALGIGDQAGLVNMMRYFSESGGINTFNSKLDEAIKAIKETGTEDVDTFVEQSTEATLLEKMQNWLSSTFGTGIWKLYPKVAVAAFTAYTASGIIKGFQGIHSFIGGIDKAGGLGKYLSGLFGKGSTIAGGAEQMSLFASGGGTAGGALGTLAAGGIAIGLTAAAIAGINSIVNAAYSKRVEVTKDKKSYYANQLKASNSPMASDSAYQNAYAASSGASTANNWNGYWGTFANITAGWLNKFNRDDPAKYNLELWRNFDRTASGTDWYNSQLGTDLRYMYSMLLINAGTPSVAQEEFGLTKSDIKKYLKTDSGSENRIKNAYDVWQSKAGLANYGSLWPIDFDGNEHSDLQLNGYHKAGLNYVPKDNYKALLHKGEMVLNEREANLLRNAMDMKNMGGVEAGWYSVDDGRRGGNYPYRITSAYKEKRSSGLGYHTGVDFAFPSGTPIGAAQAGKIDQSYFNSSYGNMVREKFNNGKYAIYAHQTKRVAKVGDKVNIGDLIGYSGSTGHSTGPHLHFEVRNSTTYGDDTDPLAYVTQGLFRTGTGSLAGSSKVSSKSSGSSGSDNDSLKGNTIPIKTTKFIPRALQFSSGGGIGGMEESVSKGVNNGIDRLINYLDGIRSEQNDQRKILEAFSKSRISESVY